MGCRTARGFLLEHQVSFDSRDVGKDPPTAAELAELLEGLEPEQFLSRRSKAFTELGYDRKLPARSRILEDIARDPNLLRRPFMVGPRGERVVGFDRDRYRDLFAKG
jgi:Spx/MgsR family transcriptional regulator